MIVWVHLCIRLSVRAFMCIHAIVIGETVSHQVHSSIQVIQTINQRSNVVSQIVVYTNYINIK